MPQPLQLPTPRQLAARNLLRIAEAARADADAVDAAGVGIAAAMRAETMDADGAAALLHVVSESLKIKLDALVEALGATC